MRTTARALTAAAGIAVAALALSGCSLLPAHTSADTATLTDTVGSVRIDGTSGNVTVQGVPGASGIRIERTFNYWGSKRDFGPTYEVSGDELVLSGCGNRCAVAYTIELPAGVDVSGSTDNGAIELEAVNDVDVQTSNGGISLDDVTGRVKAATSNGRIEGEGLAGPGVTAKTSNGSITLELDSPQSVRANTSNGAITLRVPSGSYEVNAETSLGGKTIDIPTDPNGTFLLDLETSNGAITVKPVD